MSASQNDNGGPSTPANPELSWGQSNFDRKYTFVSSFVWSLPWFKEGPARWVLGHWQVSGLFSAMSGTPLDITLSAPDQHVDLGQIAKKDAGKIGLPEVNLGVLPGTGGTQTAGSNGDAERRSRG